MVALSKKTTELIKDDIVSVLYNSPRAMFANEIARELRRDNEFVMGLLLELKKMGLVEEIMKSNRGVEYKERIRWRLRPKVIEAYEG